MLKKIWNGLTDPRVIIVNGLEDLRRRTCPACEHVAERIYDYDYFGFPFVRQNDIYKCDKCNTRWRVPRNK